MSGRSLHDRPAIDIHALSKQYMIGERERFPTLRDQLSKVAVAPVSALRSRRTPRTERASIWALRNISLVIPQGDVVGFVGRNGAGKSTLLKVLSRITAPTTGYVGIRGWVGALLEVGTGFHPELTGRENAFLNGAILGMSRAETRRKLDAIVDFAGVGAFLDTPVKRFSSGMQVRLAFAVAAHLDPEIFIVDEVLAVGDAEFQRKCLGKMGEFARDGRTVIFVSHNMSVLQTLCSRAVFLRQGAVVADGPVREVVGTYLQSLEEAVLMDVRDRTDRFAGGYRTIMLEGIRVVGAGGEMLMTGRTARIELFMSGVLQRLACRFVIFDSLGLPVATFDSDNRAPQDTIARGHSCLICEIEELPLAPGRYRIDVVVRGGGHAQDGLEAASFFDVEPGTLNDRSVGIDDSDGPVTIAHRWSSRAQRFGVE
ncbi:ABC transporter ATP-binding protein [soil metagenome]